MIERKRGCRGEEGIRERRRARGRERSWSDPECGSPKISHRTGSRGRAGHPTSGEVWGGVTELIGTSPGFASSSSSSSSCRRGKQHHPPLPAHHPRVCVATTRREEGPSEVNKPAPLTKTPRSLPVNFDFSRIGHKIHAGNGLTVRVSGAAGRPVAAVFFGLIAVVVRIGVPLTIDVSTSLAVMFWSHHNSKTVHLLI